MKRCTNCGKYPFCKDIKDAGKENDCEQWIKRNIERKQEYENKRNLWNI